MKLPERNEFTSSYEGYRYQFTGHELDGETGYQYHGARYYNEELGRYMSVDPLAQEYMGWSPYVYVLGDPVSLTDPTGMGAEDWVRKPGSAISYDSDVTTNEEAVKKYGAGAEVVATGFSFDNRSNGDHIELLDRGFFMRNGVMERADDFADVIPALPARMVSLHIDEGYASNHGQGRSIMEMFTDNGGGEVTEYLNDKGMFHYDRRSAHFADWEKARANVKAIDDFAEGIMYEAVWILSGEEIIGGAVRGVKYGYNAWKIGKNGTTAAKGGQVIIGEGMKRVSMEATKRPGSIILNNMPKFTGTADQVTSQMMTYNRQWILQQMRSGRTILDIGLDPSRGAPSIFYQMEQNMMKNYLKLHLGAF